MATTYMGRLKGIFKLTGVADGHAHRFRVPPGAGAPRHGSVKVTEKRYSPWVRARQEQPTAN